MSMEAVIAELKNWGCDVDGALERFLGDEELYVTCLQTVTEDPAFKELEVALKEERTEDAFEHSHTLKGVLANMGLVPMYNINIRIVEPLRAGSQEGLLPIYDELVESNKQLKTIIGKGNDVK